jgi:hypothetical protein
VVHHLFPQVGGLAVAGRAWQWGLFVQVCYADCSGLYPSNLGSIVRGVGPTCRAVQHRTP